MALPINKSNDIFKTIVLAIITATFIPTCVFAQMDKDTSYPTAISNANDIGKLMVEFSRPGKYHRLLADLVGTWTFEGRRLPHNPALNKTNFDFFGTHTRKPFAEGRFFIVDMTMGDSLHQQLIPLKEGKMEEAIGKGIAIEGYNNVKNKFEQAYVTNHVGSDITFWEGTYDATTKTITFNTEQEIISGMKDKLRELFIIHDKDNYTIEFYNVDNGKYVKNAEVNFTRLK